MSADRVRDPEQRAERGARLLDAAADLLLTHGYRRVTMDDVADAVGIGKGTVYLHWRTREQLFAAVFAREVLNAIDELGQALRDEPQTCLLHNFARVYFLAIVNRPLLRGLLLDDPRLLGKLTTSAGGGRDQRHATMVHAYLELLAEQGLLRDDMNVDEIGYAYQAIFEGFLRALDAGPGSSSEQRADLLARTVRRAFESDSTITGTVLRNLAAAAATLLADLVATDRAASGLP